MKHLFFAALCCCSVAVFANYETTVFEDNFDRGGINYTITKSDDANPVIENNILLLPCPRNSTTGKIQVTNNFSTYQSPFRLPLDSIKADSIVWTWNMRQNYAKGSNRLSGFGKTRALAVILAADNTDLNQANGYAVVMNGNGKVNYHLVRFANGLTTDDNLTDIVGSDDLGDEAKNYMALKVVFIPATHTWRLALDKGNASSFTAPSATTPFVLCGEKVDNTFTDNVMKTFGFHMNYGGSTAFNLYIDNYSVRTFTDYKPEPIKPIVVHELELPLCITNHMIIQRDEPMQIWGWGTAGDTIAVSFTRGENTITDSAIVNEQGKWLATLPQQSVCAEPCSMHVQVVNQSLSADVTDILVGDVWLAVGQSNMEKRMDHLTEYAQYMSEANSYPLVRYYRTAYNASTTPLDHAKGDPWYICNATNLSKASAVAYVFARKLQEELQIPIGIVGAYRGGTELETWLSQDKIDHDPELAFLKGRQAIADKTSTSAYPAIHNNGQVQPLKNYKVKGIIYYQGESNIKRALEFRFMTRKIAEDLRESWQQPHLPFYYVQIFNCGPTSNGLYEEGNWQDIREQQELALYDPHTANLGMAVIIETNEQSKNTNESERMHPHTKKPVGERLANLALREVYNKDIVAYSPQMERFYVQQDTMFIVMKHVAEGLAIRNDSNVLTGFVLSDNSHNFVAAQAKIMNDSVVALHSNQVTQPYAARYAWAKDPVCNLINSAGLPATPFRTDAWPSKFSYSKFPYTAPASSDNTLIGVRINGKWLSTFTNQQTDYTFAACESEPYVAAYTNHPTAQISIKQVTNMGGDEAERTATITVTAEDNSIKTFHFVFPQRQVSALSSIREEKAPFVYDLLGRKVSNTTNNHVLSAGAHIMNQQIIVVK